MCRLIPVKTAFCSYLLLAVCCKTLLQVVKALRANGVGLSFSKNKKTILFTIKANVHGFYRKVNCEKSPYKRMKKYASPLKQPL